MEYLKLFETETEYNNEASGLIYPTVSYVNDTDTVYVMQKPNYFIATYNVTSTSSATSLLISDFDFSQVSEMYVDDVQVTPSSVYTFTTTGSHKVKMVFNDNFNSCGFMFENCESLTSIDLSNLDTSNVTDIAGMFYGCTGLTSLDLSNLDTSNVTNMFDMFTDCSSLTSLDLSNFDTSKVTDMNNMFTDCSSLTSLDLSNFDTSNVTDMFDMFTDCSSLTSLDLSNFDTSNVTDIAGMFYGCTGLTSLDLSNLDTSNVISMQNMFTDCSSLTSVKMLGPTRASANTYKMFDGISTTGTFYYNDAYDYSRIIAVLPSTWTAVAV